MRLQRCSPQPSAPTCETLHDRTAEASGRAPKHSFTLQTKHHSCLNKRFAKTAGKSIAVRGSRQHFRQHDCVTSTSSPPEASPPSRFRETLSAVFDTFEKVGQFPFLWRGGRLDALPLILIAVLPLLVALPKLLGWLRADPMLYFGAMATGYVGGLLPGVPYLDPNDGLTTQALGYRAALDWLHGQVPWWNPYSGVGLPLAAEFQPAVFFPLTLLLLLPQGIVWQHTLLQAVAGWGSYGLLRQLGLGRTAALTGALLYAFNGTLAWFGHSPAFPVPFLPWMLWGIERAYVKAALDLRGGWRLLSIALAMSLLGGFPETAYLDGLLVAAWTLLRMVQTRAELRWAFAWRIALGAAVGIALCAPQLLAFFEFLPIADIGGHGGLFGRQSLDPWAALPSLIEPHFFLPVIDRQVEGLSLLSLFSTIGGYVTLGIVLLAVYETVKRFDPLNRLLMGWAVFALAKTFGIEPFATIWRVLPGIAETAFTRYAAPSWEMALIILAARCVDGLRSERPHRAALLAALAVLLTALTTAAVAYAKFLQPNVAAWSNAQYFAAASLLWTAATGFACLVLLRMGPARWSHVALAVLMIGDGTLMYAIPTLSNPRGGEIDMAAIRFLRDGLGLQRFYTLGPIQPNYGAYFGIGSINAMYMPVPLSWAQWVRARLDRYADADNFVGEAPRLKGAATATEELRERVREFEAVGVKYVVATGNPFIKTLSSQTEPHGMRPLLLQAGKSASGTLPANLVQKSVVVNAVGVLLGNYSNTSDGSLELTLCSGLACETGIGNLKESRDNAVFYITLARPLEAAPNTQLRFTINHVGGYTPVALWIFSTSGDGQTQNLRGPDGPVDGAGLRLTLQLATAGPLPKQVYADELLNIYELPGVKPYFEIIGGGPCTLQASERTRIAANCRSQATLVRRELYFPGWTAEVDGKAARIAPFDGLFQKIMLAPGESDVRYRYAPPNVGWAWAVTLLAFLPLLREGLLCWRAAKNRTRRAVAA